MKRKAIESKDEQSISHKKIEKVIAYSLENKKDFRDCNSIKVELKKNSTHVTLTKKSGFAEIQDIYDKELTLRSSL